MSSNSTTSSILDQLRSKTLSVSDWTSLSPSISDRDIPTVVHTLLELITQEETYYTDYLRSFILLDSDEDRITDLQELVFSLVDTTVLEKEWFSTIWSGFLEQTNSADLVENFFIFLDQLYAKQPFQYNSKFIQSLLSIPSSLTRFNLMMFLAEHQLHLFENTEILQLFFSVPESFKLKFIPILLSLPPTNCLFISKEIMFSDIRTTEPYVVLAVLFHMRENLHDLFDSYETFLNFVESLQNQKILELLFAEYTKPDSTLEPWIQKLLLEYELSKFIIESSGEYIADWQEDFRKEFLQLILSSYNSLQTALASILSPVWYDEKIILKLLESDNKTVRETLFESVILIYQLLGKELQEKFFNLCKEEPKNQNLYGLLLAYNFQIPAFFKGVKQLVQDLSNQAYQQQLAGVLVGLGMRWNDIDKDFQTTLKNSIKYMSGSQQQELRKGMEIIYGSLDLEAINIVTNLQGYENQISPDNISLD